MSTWRGLRFLTVELFEDSSGFFSLDGIPAFLPDIREAFAQKSVIFQNLFHIARAYGRAGLVGNSVFHAETGDALPVSKQGEGFKVGDENVQSDTAKLSWCAHGDLLFSFVRSTDFWDVTRKSFVISLCYEKCN